MPVGESMTALSGGSALAAATIAPPPEGDIPFGLEAAVRQACAGAWRAIEVVLAGDVLRGRLAKTRDTIVREAVSGVLELFGNVGIRADALAALRAARDAGALDDALDITSIVEAVRTHGAVAVGRGAVTDIRRGLVAHRDLEAVLADHELASLLIDAARACFRGAAYDPALAAWAIGPTGSPGRDRALAAFAELAGSPESLDELEMLIALPIHLDDNVQFTVYRPRTIDPGKWHQLLAFAHLAERRPGEDDLPDPVEEVQRQAASVLGAKAQQYQPVIQDSGSAIPDEGELTFVPEFPGIEVNPPRRSFLWLETVHREEFRMRAGRELDGKTVRGRMTVFLGHIAIAEVALSVRVDAEAGTPEKVREPQHARAYRKIFASYSHRDIEVVNQFETYARALGDEYLRDWVHLRTGEVWTDRLCQLIEQADAFQLFWSRNSMHSKFVRQEYEHALSLGRPSFVRPTYWEEPMPTAPGLPPESLLRLHFQKLGAETVTTVGAGSRQAEALREQPVIARKKRAREPDLDSMEREHAHAPADDTKQTLAREAVGVEEAIDSWDSETDQDQASRLREAARHSTDVDELIDPGDSFSETRKDIAPAPPRREEPRVKSEVPKRLTTQPGPGTSADVCPSCGTTNQVSAAYCRNCGRKLSGESSSAPRRPGPPSAPASMGAGSRKSMMSEPAVRPPRPTESSPSTAMRPPPMEPPAPSRAIAARPGGSMPGPSSMPPRSAPAPSMPMASQPRPTPAPSPASRPPRPAESSPLPESITSMPPPSSPAPPPGPAPSPPRPQAESSTLPAPMPPRTAPAPAPSTPLRAGMLPSAPSSIPPRPAPMASPSKPRPAPMAGHAPSPSPMSPRPIAPTPTSPSPVAPMDSWTDESSPAPEWSDEEPVSAPSKPEPRPTPSPDSWSDNDWAEEKEASSRPRRVSAPPPMQPRPVDAKPSLFPPGPISRPTPSPVRQAAADPSAPKLFPPADPPAPQRISSPSQLPPPQPPPPQPITTTLPGVVHDAPLRPSAPAIMPPMSSPAIIPPGSPASATMLAPTPPQETFPEDATSPTPVASPGGAPGQQWLKQSDGALPFAPTVQHHAYQPGPDDFTNEAAPSPDVSANVGMMMKQADIDMGSARRPEAPAAHGWILAVVLVLIVAAIVVLLIVL